MLSLIAPLRGPVGPWDRGASIFVVVSEQEPIAKPERRDNGQSSKDERADRDDMLPIGQPPCSIVLGCAMRTRFGYSQFRPAQCPIAKPEAPDLPSQM